MVTARICSGDQIVLVKYDPTTGAHVTYMFFVAQQTIEGEVHSY